ncbi:hypothetical protein Q2T46_04145 [Thermoanaerobacterium sp. CMT5567-10]|nr:hypothetical protein [Thermoanaerobacterium sp. CMT5567-10]WKV09650.1 hypothetical protein Q2T46_04145 [Thermoanaerobacterium sp. CMT5567-10]
MKWNKQSLDVVGTNEERLSSLVPTTYIVKILRKKWKKLMTVLNVETVKVNVHIILIRLIS